MTYRFVGELECIFLNAIDENGIIELDEISPTLGGFSGIRQQHISVYV